MWIVRLALNRPYTFIVAAILILVLGLTSIATTPTDIFPNIDIPVVSVIWSYSGLSAKEMEQRITTFSEFVMAVVNDVKAIDSQTVNGASVIKISFQPRCASMPPCHRLARRSKRFATGCRPASIRHGFCASALRRSPLSSFRFRVIHFPNRNSTTTDSSGSGSSCRPCLGPSCQLLTAVLPARSWWTWTRMRSSRRA
jgi:hypothetical protein